MAYALATRLERAVKNAGVKYKKVSGWASRGHGTMGSIQSVICHHTAGPRSGNSPSLNVVAYGRPGLSGPLAQLFLARDGTVYLVAAGISYHAGRVSSSRYANSHAIGIEAEATGLDSWPAHQINEYAKLCKALIKEFGLSTSRVRGHKEVAVPRGRKPDPNFSMSDFRKKVGGAKGGVSSGGGTSGGSSRSYKSVSYGTTLGKWDKGDPVKDWQDFLKAQGYDLGKGGVDGYFGDSTVSATKKYQKKVGVKVDGMAGKDTWAKAKKDGLKWKRKKASKSAPYPLPKGHFYYTEDKRNTVHSGYWGEDRPAIRKIQKKVGTGVDGRYGPKTKAAVMRWQKKHGLKADGAVGANTWAKMF